MVKWFLRRSRKNSGVNNGETSEQRKVHRFIVLTHDLPTTVAFYCRRRVVVWMRFLARESRARIFFPLVLPRRKVKSARSLATVPGDYKVWSALVLCFPTHDPQQRARGLRRSSRTPREKHTRRFSVGQSASFYSFYNGDAEASISSLKADNSIRRSLKEPFHEHRQQRVTKCRCILIRRFGNIVRQIFETPCFQRRRTKSNC